MGGEVVNLVGQAASRPLAAPESLIAPGTM